MQADMRSSEDEPICKSLSAAATSAARLYYTLRNGALPAGPDATGEKTKQVFAMLKAAL